MNVLWIVVDTLRADRLNCYGYFRKTSPTIDQLAREGVLFEDFQSSGISTGAAFTCLFTGLPSIAHRYYATPAHAFNLMDFDDTIPTLPEIVQSNSEHITVAVDNLINFAGHMEQMVRGFEFYINPSGESGFPHPEYTAEEANRRFLPWLRGYAREPFFAFVHLWDPHHAPYRAPGFRRLFRHEHASLNGLPVRRAGAGYDYVPGWGRVGEIAWGMSLQERYGPEAEVDGGVGTLGADRDQENDLTHDLYDGSVAHADQEIRRMMDVLEERGVLDQTIVVLTADHGEGLGNHGIWGHGLPYEDTIHIPLILWRPGLLPEGHRVHGFAQHIDVAPTILDLMGIYQQSRPVGVRLGDRFTWQAQGSGDTDIAMEGRSLLPHIRGKVGGREYALTEVRRGPGDPGYRTLTVKPWKLIESLAGERQLYNLDDDPMEKVNLAAARADLADSLSRQLGEWVQRHLQPGEEDPMRIWPVPGGAS